VIHPLNTFPHGLVDLIIDLVSIDGCIGGGSSDSDSVLENPRNLIAALGGNLYVIDHASSQIRLFHRSGKLLDCWGSGVLSKPNGIARSDRNGLIFVTDTDDEIKAFQPNSDFQYSFGGSGYGDGQFRQPDGIVCVDVNDEEKLYIVDCHNHRVQVMRPGGDFIHKFDMGHDSCPLGLAYGENLLFVTLHYEHCVKVFRLDGALINTWTAITYDNSNAFLLFEYPRAITYNNGHVYVADRHYIQTFLVDGTILQNWTLKNETSSRPGALGGEVGGMVIIDNILYVSETINNRIELFG